MTPASSDNYSYNYVFLVFNEVYRPKTSLGVTLWMISN
jgi:hypothetical protein